MIRCLIVFSAMLCGVAIASTEAGNAKVEWIGESSSCEPGKPLHTAIRMIHEPGWHSYWINPGEAGMKTSVEWKLPAGWKCGNLGFPAPARFLTSDLAGFGYEGNVLFPVMITPPADFKGKSRLSAEISWLACGEQGCVPGKAEIHLDVSAGPMKPTAHAGKILSAHQQLPRPAEKSVRLAVLDKGKSLVLVIETVSGTALDLDGREFFPATPDVIDPKTPILFVRKDASWISEVTKSEFAASPVRHLTLVLGPKKEHDAWELTWTAP